VGKEQNTPENSWNRKKRVGPSLPVDEGIKKGGLYPETQRPIWTWGKNVKRGFRRRIWNE